MLRWRFPPIAWIVVAALGVSSATALGLGAHVSLLPTALAPSVAGGLLADVSPASTVGPALGEQRWYKTLSFPLSDRLNVHVNLANGNLSVHQKDLELKGTGLSLGIDQHYNSLSTSRGSVGNHWVLDSGADVRLQLPGDGSAVYFGPSGFSLTFLPLTGGGFGQPPGLDASLVKNGDGTFTMTFHQSDEKYNFSAAGLFASDVDRNGNTITYAYDSGGHLASVTDTQGRRTVVASNAAGLIGSITDPANRTYGFSYDGSGNLVGYTDPAGKTAAFAYSAASDLTQVTDPAGRQTRLTYDGSHRVTSLQLLYDAVNGTGPRTTFAYSGATTTVTDPNPRQTTYTSDSAGRVSQATDSQGAVASMTYTANYNPASGTDPLGNQSTLTYDSLHNPTAAHLPTGAQATAVYGNTSHRYLATSITDTQGNVTQYAYDAAGNLTQVTDALNRLTKYAYNANGTPSSVTDASGNVTTYQYDGVGNLTGIFPTGLDYAYDALSRVVATTDAKGQKTTTSYDLLDRPTQVTHADGTTTTQTYDADGNRTSLVDSTGTTTFTYDAIGRLSSKTLPSGEVISFGYDGAGDLVTRHDSGGTVSYTYNGAGLLGSISDAAGAKTGFGYDAAHQLTSIAYPNGVSVNYQHNSALDVTSITAVKNSSNTLLKRVYSYVNPANGMQTLQRYTVTDQAGAVTTYGYDAVNRLTSAVVNSSAGKLMDSRTYAYDAVGNRTSQTINGTTTTYSYDLTNGKITAGNVTYDYDANGNLIDRTGGWFWDYNTANFTTAITHETSACQAAGFGDLGQDCITIVTDTVWPMTYSGLDQTERVTLEKTSFVNDSTGLTRRTDPAGSTYEVRDLNRHLLSERGPSGTFYVIPDAVGSTIGLTDANGSLAATWTYDPFGNTISQTGSVSTPVLFQGGYIGPDGNYKMGSRYYDPATGRYLQVDNQQGGLANPQTLNRYVFELDNPVNNPATTPEQPTGG